MTDGLDFSWTPELRALRDEAAAFADEAIAAHGVVDDAWINGYSKDVSRALVAGDLPQARRSFTEYREQVLAHLAREEDVSFPAAEKRAPAQGGPIRSLRVAHIGIRSDLERVASQLALGGSRRSGPRPPGSWRSRSTSPIHSRESRSSRSPGR